MKYLISILSLCVVASALPSYPYPVHAGVGAIYKGPNSETIIRGPDGSIITSEAIGGHVAIGETPIVHQTPILQHGPIVHAPLAHAPLAHAPLIHVPLIHEPLIHAPILHSNGPVLLPNLGPTILQNNPIIVDDLTIPLKDPKIVEEHVLVGNKIITVPKKLEENTDLIGPSGTISTRGGDVVISGPASTTIKGGGVVSSIEKQPDLHLKSVEIKPVAAPIILGPAHTPVIAHVAPVIESQTIIQSGPIISEARPIVRPIYAEAAPVYSVNPLLLPNTPIVRVDKVLSNGDILGNHGFGGNFVANQLAPHHLNAHQLGNHQFTASAPSLTVPSPNLAPVQFEHGLQATINQADLNFLQAGQLLNNNAGPGPHYAASYPSFNPHEGIYRGPHYHNGKPIYRGPVY